LLKKIFEKLERNNRWMEQVT